MRAGGPGLPSRDELTKAWGDQLLGQLPGRVRARYSSGRFVGVEGGTALFALPNEAHRQQCEQSRPEVEAVLTAHYGMPVPLRLVVDPAETRSEPAPGDDRYDMDQLRNDMDQLRDAPSAVTSPEDVVRTVFPGAEEVQP